MQQEGDDGRGGGCGAGRQDRRLKTVQGGDGQVLQQQQPQPQKCPRCDSPNTKFCYYNNYSLSQPRYFCKACRRYWTQGGTLRNVPVGGGCRKGKRAKTTASSSTTAEISSRSLPVVPQEVVVQQRSGRANILSTDHPIIRDTKDLSAALASPPPVLPPGISPYYQGTDTAGDGGYLSSLAAIQLNPSQPIFNQGLSVGTDALGSSNLDILSGFGVASLGSQRQIRPPSQFFQMGSREREIEALFPAEQGGLVQSTMANNSTCVSRHDWPQSFITNATSHRPHTDASLWSTISTSSISGNSGSNANSGSSALIPNQWPDLPGYGPPP